MTQSFMYKRVNIFLLIMMCLIVVGLAGSAVYFQESFKNLNTNYEGVLSNFTSCTDILSDKQNRLLSCISDLNSTEGDIGKYDVLYEQKVGQLENTQSELVLTDRELKNTKLELQKAESLYQSELKRVTDLEVIINKLNQDIVSLKASLQSCQDQLAAC